MIPDSENWWWYNPYPHIPDCDPVPVWVYRSGRGFAYIRGIVGGGPVSKVTGIWKGRVVKWKGSRV